jgi:hypothetical protein
MKDPIMIVPFALALVAFVVGGVYRRRDRMNRKRAQQRRRPGAHRVGGS